MKRLIIFPLFLSLLFTSCGEEEQTTDNSEPQKKESNAELEKLELENQRLQKEIAFKDSMLTQTAETFRIIEDNLSQITAKQKKINLEGIYNEESEDPKAWIMNEIEEINKLRASNLQQIASLKRKASEKEKENSGLLEFIETLQNQIDVKDQEITQLQTQLTALDNEYSEMFDEYLEMAANAENLTDELHEAFYAYGTKSELTENNVLSKEGGVLGIGGSYEVSGDMNTDYFRKIDIRQTKEINITGKKPEIKTNHPTSSYTLTEGDGSSVLSINDEEKFWSMSKYLVIEVK